MTHLEELAARVRSGLLAARSFTEPGLGSFALTGPEDRPLPMMRGDRALTHWLSGKGERPDLGPAAAEIASALKGGEELHVAGFGTFSLAKRRGFVGHDPRTGGTMQVSPRVLIQFTADPELKTALKPGPPDPWRDVGTFQLDRYAGRFMLRDNLPRSEPDPVLVEAAADPRWAELMQIDIRGAHDGDAVLIAERAPARLEVLVLREGTLSAASTPALAGLAGGALRRVCLADNLMSPRAIAELRVLPGLEPGVQSATPDALPGELYGNYSLDWDVVLPLVGEWADKLHLELVGLCRKVGDAAAEAALNSIARTNGQHGFWRSFAIALGELELHSGHPATPAVRQLVGIAANAMREVVGGALDGDFGNDSWWIARLGDALAQAVGLQENWVDDGIPVLVVSASERALQLEQEKRLY